MARETASVVRFREWLRRRRFQTFARILQEECQGGRRPRILDVGGRITYWQNMANLFDLSSVEITVMNLNSQASLAGVKPDFDLAGSPFTLAEGNVCAMPEFADGAFDIVHSNSVIEHLGEWPNMRAAANEISRVGRRYFVQVPYFWFPYEPHYMSIGFHWLPEQVRARRYLRKKVGWKGPFDNYDDAIAAVRAARILDATQMRSLFPDARLERERVIITKSLMAVR